MGTWSRMRPGWVRRIRKSSSWWARPAICRGASFCPGLFHLCAAGFITGCRIIGVALEDLDAEGFRKFARDALNQFSTRKVNEADWAAFAETLTYVPLSAGAPALKAAVDTAEA